MRVSNHRLCQSPQRHLSTALNEFLVVLKNQRKFAEQWAEVMVQAGRDTDAATVQQWGEQLVGGLKAYKEDCYEVTVAMFSALIEYPEIEPQWQAIACAWRGETYRLMHRYEEALSDFNQAIDLDPTSDWKLASRGETYHAMERYQEALSDFNQAINLDPKYAWAIASRGQTYQAMERYQEALSDFNCAVELLDAEEDWLLYDRAITYQKLGQVEAAKTDLAQAIRLAQIKYEKDSSNNQNTFNLALYYLASGENEQAKHFYRDALHQGAPVPAIQEALRDVKDFLTIFPNHPLAQQVHRGLQKKLQK